MTETSLIQARVDTELKNDASDLFDSLGLDMTTAIRIFLKKCLQEGGIPFEIKNSESSIMNAYKAFMMLRKQAEENGLSDMSLDEINSEISAARKARNK
ncbi:MAG: type II toxin-antitoxin system RelB/DinJ family antitoxin [Erysipelotrichaceae bacterium]|nr:type II toxin-antitoxin system RelB/DinJ family antitoxin [Erysipelotrichaceae bacterium]